MSREQKRQPQQSTPGFEGQFSPFTTAEVPHKRISREETRLGQTLDDRYLLVELIGKGGMAVVYKALDKNLQMPVAVKMLLPHVQEEEFMTERFLREAKSSCKVNHPNIVKLIDFGGVNSDSPYIVVEYLAGQSLSQLLKEQKQLGVERTLHIFAQICEALDQAHRKNIIHRDLKPSNIMLIEHEADPYFVKVVDFGLAKSVAGDQSQQLTQTGEVFGSPVYMSPEQCRGGELDGRSDIYSLGIMMYECLSGKVPFHCENIVATITKHLHETPPALATIRPDLYIPEKLESVVRKALEKSPQDRYATMAEFKEAMLAAVPGRVPSAGLRQSSNEPMTFGKALWMERAAIALAAAMVVAVAAAAIYVLSSAPVNRESRREPVAGQRRSEPAAVETIKNINTTAEQPVTGQPAVKVLPVENTEAKPGRPLAKQNGPEPAATTPIENSNAKDSTASEKPTQSGSPSTHTELNKATAVRQPSRTGAAAIKLKADRSADVAGQRKILPNSSKGNSLGSAKSPSRNDSHDSNQNAVSTAHDFHAPPRHTRNHRGTDNDIWWDQIEPQEKFSRRPK